MGIPKKKRQVVRRSFPALSVADIAGQTGLSPAEVKTILGIDRREETARKSGQYDVLLEWAILACVFCAPFVMIPGLRDAANLAQNAFVQVTSLVLAGAWVVKQAVVDKKITRVNSFMILPLGAFVIWCLLSVFWTVNRYEVVPVFMQGLAMVLFFLVVLQTCARKPFSENLFSSLYDRMVAALVLAGCGIAIIGICQYLFGFSLIPQARPPAATFANRNMASQFMVLVIPFSLYLLARASSTWVAWAAAMGAALMLVYVVYIQSLAAWVAVFAEMVALAALAGYLHVKNRPVMDLRARLAPLAAMGVVFVVLIHVNGDGFHFRFKGIFQEIQRIQTFIGAPVANVAKKTDGLPDQGNIQNQGNAQNQNDGQNQGDPTEEPRKTARAADRKTAGAAGKPPGVSTLQWRWSIWMNSLAMIRDNLLPGVGAGNFRVIYPLYNQAVIKDQKFSIETQPVHAHNDYIQAGAELGVAGLAIIGWTIGCFFYMAAVLVRGAENNRTRLLAGAMLAAGTGILVNAGFSFPFQRAIPPYISMLICGMAAALFVRQKKAKPRISANRFFLYGTGAVMVLLSGFYAYYHYNGLQFDRYYGRTIHHYNQNQWHKSLAAAEKALTYRPKHNDLLYFYTGYARNRMGDTRESIASYHRLLTHFPNYLNALINLGVAYGKSGMHDKAIAMYEQVVRILPDRFEYYNDIGHYSLQAGDLDQAFAYFTKAAALNGNNATIQANLGVVCLQMKKFDRAKQYFKKALALDPEGKRPRQFLDLIESR